MSDPDVEMFNRNLMKALVADNDKMRAEVERLKAALRPFAINPGAISLSTALGHITREHLLAARAALEGKP